MLTRRLAPLALILAACGLLTASPALADPQRVGPLSVDLLAEQTSVTPGQPFMVGLRFVMDPEWHVYWRNPGDSGLSPSIEWTLPDGFTATEIMWPYPEAIIYPPLVSIGYEYDVLLPIQITPPAELEPGTTVPLVAKASWLVCKEECLPGEAMVELSLPVGEGPPQVEETTKHFAESFAKLPVAESGWSAGVTSNDTSIFLHLAPTAEAAPLKTATFFPFDSDIIEYAEPQTLVADGTGYTLTITRSQFATPGEVTSLTGIVVSDEGWRGPDSGHAIEITATQGRPPAMADMTTATDGVGIVPPAGTTTTAPPANEVKTLWQALLWAFIGGVILNLMPCVLPVLSLKIFGFIKHAGDDRKRTLMHGLVFTGGVLLSFWILAAVLIALRAGSEQIGWGFHLQSPMFLMVLCAFLFLFAMSLLGNFEIGATLTGIGGATHHIGGFAGSFLNGVTATVVATPCTAPFMGPALGFALTQSTMGIVGIFTAIGLGMAAPYLALSANPGWLKFVPKPGAWMDTFKQAMGFLLLATVVWLAYVLGEIAGVTAMTALGATLLLLAVGSWILKEFAPITAPMKAQRTAQVTAAIMMLLGLAVGLAGAGSAPVLAAGEGTAIAAESGPIDWEPYSEARIAELKAAGTPIFIDFTAAWCLSCQVNERVAIYNPEVVKKLHDLNIATIKADWTKRDAEITRALAGYQRNSVPLYVLISATGETTFLPEVLTPGIVLNALKQLE